MFPLYRLKSPINFKSHVGLAVGIRYFGTKYNELKKLLNSNGSLDQNANQTIHHDPKSEIGKILQGIIETYGKGDQKMSYAFGYGSKVFSQGPQVDISNSQIDMIYVVNNSYQWHKNNIKIHSTDYSSLKYLGAGSVDIVGKWGAGVYFNPFVNLNINNIPMELKYGVTSYSTLCNDLLKWDTLYLAGRLQKPVAIVQNHSEISLYLQFNLISAVRLAVLILNKDVLSERELYMTIAGLSYMGDPRLKVNGENPDKVKNIVNNQFNQFHLLYEPVISNYLDDLLQMIRNDNNEYVYKVNRSAMGDCVREMPSSFKTRLLAPFIQPSSPVDDVINQLKNNEIQKAAISAVETTVASSAIVQSLKGVATAGVVRSWRYAMAKRAKAQKAAAVN